MMFRAAVGLVLSLIVLAAGCQKSMGKTFDIGWHVPEKYCWSKSTPLTVTIPADGELLFELTD